MHGIIKRKNQRARICFFFPRYAKRREEEKTEEDDFAMRLSDSKVEGTFEIYTLMDFGSIFVAEKRMQRRERRFSVDFFLEKKRSPPQ